MYSPAARTVCYYFLSKDVAAERVSPLIVSCINNLTDNSISLVDLPSASCINSMNLELGNISHQQISYIISINIERWYNKEWKTYL